MAKRRNGQSGDQGGPELPQGVKLLRTLKGHEDVVLGMAGRTLAGGGRDSSVRLWEVASGKPLRTLKGSEEITPSVVFDPAAV